MLWTWNTFNNLIIGSWVTNTIMEYLPTYDT